MKELWVEAYDNLADELDREPLDSEVEVEFQNLLGRLHDAADAARKAKREAEYDR